MFENIFFACGVVKFYNPRRYSRGHRRPSLARAPWPPFYYYKKVRCMRRMCGRTGLPLLEDLCFHTLSKSGCRAFNSNVLRMCPNVPECATNVRPNVRFLAARLCCRGCHAGQGKSAAFFVNLRIPPDTLATLQLCHPP